MAVDGWHRGGCMTQRETQHIAVLQRCMLPQEASLLADGVDYCEYHNDLHVLLLLL